MNPHPVLETETPCLWCDGTGLHLYAAYADRSRVQSLSAVLHWRRLATLRGLLCDGEEAAAMSDEVSPLTGRRYTAPHVAMRGPGERLPAWTCQCKRPDGRRLLRNYRHTEPWQCLRDEDVSAFVAAYPEAPPRKHLAWLWREFSREGARA